jgi:hypothetical protein
MASTDTRSGFRLPWSSDRSHDQQPVNEPVAEGDGSEVEATADAVDPAWPETDFNARLGLTSQPRPADPSDELAPGSDEPAAEARPTTEPVSATAPEDPAMLDQAAVTAPARTSPRKPSKLMVDLAAAIRATAESAREQALAQVDADVAKVVEEIRAGSKEGESALKVKSDEDIASIREWSRGEIARIKAETDERIDARKGTLAAELDAHAAAIEGRVAEVEGTADAYRTEMASYAERLTEEEDPAFLATMAESMPDAPSLEALADLGNLAWAIPVVEDVDDEPEAVLETVEPEPAVEAVAEAVAEEPSASVDAVIADGSEDAPEAEAVAEVIEPVAVETEAVAEVETVDAATTWDAATADAESAEPETAAEAESAWGEPAAADPWGDDASSWKADDDTPRWAAGETPDGFPEAEEGGDPVDRGAIMAALEAAAEAVVAAESAAESAGQAEAAADVAETAAEMLMGRVDADELDPEAHAAMAARVDAGGVEESYTDRLAKLLPNHEAATDGEPRTTQVVVSGLVSVASIASFKRHLGRIAGVSNVTVASGPDGEFMFNVTHGPEVSFRDALPTMPGFAARVTSSADGVVQVTARDPEAEG